MSSIPARITSILVLAFFSNVCDADTRDSTTAVEKCLAAGGNWTPLMCAAREGHLPAMRSLLGSNTKASTHDQEAALWLASSRGHQEIVDLLLKTSVDVNAGTDQTGGAPPWMWSATPLMVAAHNGKREIVEVLLKAGADVNAEMSRGWNRGYTALYLASRAGEKEVIELLLRAGADPNHKTNGRRESSALGAAAGHGHRDVVEILLNAGADVNAESDGLTALHSAAMNGRFRIVQSLIQAGADVNRKDKETGWTPLHLAENSIVVKELLKAGADIDAIDHDGDTPLHNAAFDDNWWVATYLIDQGANINAVNKDGKTPRDLAEAHAAAFIDSFRPVDTTARLWDWIQYHWLYAMSALLLFVLGCVVGFAVKQYVPQLPLQAERAG